MYYYKNDPYYPYYCHDKAKQQEYLFLDGCNLEEERYFWGDIEETYSVGTLLCKCLNVLSEIFELSKIANGLFSDEIDDLSIEIPKVFETHFSYKDKGYNTPFDELKIFMELYLFEKSLSVIDPEEFNFDEDKFTKLKNCLSFATLCSQNHEYSNLDSLVKFSFLISSKIKSSFKILKGSLDGKNLEQDIQCALTPTEIKMLFEGQLYDDYFMEDDYEKDFQDNNETYVELFSLNSLADFILISLHELFSAGKTIKKCEICGKFFIPKRADAKYCNGIYPGAENRTCQEEGKLRKQNERFRLSETKRMFRSISEMMKEKISNLEAEGKNVEANALYEEFLDFRNKNNEFKAKCERYEISELEYIEWLRSFYKRKYK